jgi:hypothetical protein
MLHPGLGFAGNLVDQLLPFGKNAPANLRNEATSFQVNYSAERGSEKLATVNVPAGTPNGTVLFQTFVNSSTLGPRMAAFADLWDKTRYVDVVFSVTSSAPTSVSGAYIQAIDPDPVVPYSSSEALPSQLMALQSCSTVSAWAPSDLRLKKTGETAYFNFFDASVASDAEYRQFAPGRYILATNTDFPDAVDLTVNVHWSVLFERPVLTNTALGDEDSGNTYLLSLRPESDTTNQFAYAAGSTLASCPNDSPYWSRGLRPPPGSYPVAFDVNVGSIRRHVTLLTVTAASGASSTLTLTATTQWNFSNPGSGSASAQNPDPLIVDVPAQVVGKRWRPMVRTGFCLHHPFLRVGRRELDWFNVTLVKREARRLAAVRQQAGERYAIDKMYEELVGKRASPMSAFALGEFQTPENEGRDDPPSPEADPSSKSVPIDLNLTPNLIQKEQGGVKDLWSD